MNKWQQLEKKYCITTRQDEKVPITAEKQLIFKIENKQLVFSKGTIKNKMDVLRGLSANN